MIKTIQHNGNVYPEFQSKGNAAKFAIPFALEVCKGIGYDIGYSNPEWKLPGAIGVDLRKIFIKGCELKDESVSALSLPSNIEPVSYIFSSHCLEHLNNWVDVLDYWISNLKDDGVLFLYLPDLSQSYWRPWHNRKHVNSFTPEIIKAYFFDKGMHNIFVSGIDLNNSFMAMATKPKTTRW